MITSKSSSQYKRIKKLLTSPKARKEEGLFVVEGERICAEIPKGLLEAEYISESYVRFHGVLPGAVVISDTMFVSLSDTISPQGILALVRQPAWSADEIIKAAPKRALFLMLDDIRDPGNLGTIIRTAEAAGVSGVFMSRGCADIFNPKVIRSTMGSIFRVPFAECVLSEAAALLKAKGAAVYAACLEAGTYYNEEIYGEQNALIIGNEARGVSDEVLDIADKKIKIPMAGEVESLNAAISCAVIMYGIKERCAGP